MYKSIVLAATLSALFTVRPVIAAEVGTGEFSLSAARSMATDGQRDKALDLLKTRLVEEPGDSDARVLYGIVLSWEGRYEESRQQLSQVLAGNPTHGDALPALVNVELWSDHPERVEALTKEGLRSYATNSTLLLGRARALKNLRRNREALQVLDRLLDIDPRNQEAVRLQEGLRDSGRQWEVGLDHSYEWFNDGRSAWQEDQLSLKRRLPFGSVITHFSHANHFGIGSNQAELDFYPKFRPGTYAYVNLGYSPDANLYPRYRIGADLYQSLGHGFEGSAGFRRLGFGGRVNIFTSSVGKYYGNWLFTGRVFLTPDSAGTSRSVSFSARRYFGEGSDYVGFRVGKGASPVETRSLLDIEILDSSSFAAEIQRSLDLRWSIRARAGASYEERLGRSFLRHYTLDGGIFFRF
jgi:YaiO family outer membrane protein